jgi:thioesterase domain-containing protein
LDLFVPLSLGGKVVLAANTLALAGLAAAAEVRMMTTVPSVMSELLRLGGLPSSVETINLGGEPLSRQLVDQLYARPHVKRVYDLYGPTETTTCSTFALRVAGKPATIGRPIAQTRIYLLDEQLRPVPAGATGELYIGGEGVARGYLNRPEATAERFVQLTFVDGSTRRVYRTGDHCRHQPDGNLEFIGRLDRQVKIRGFRIELGEIESALLDHAAVSEAVVIAHESAAGVRRLAAYVVPSASARREERATTCAAPAAMVAQLRSHLQGRLPHYMLPATIMLLERFDLTANGKVDYACLPAPARTGAAAADSRAARTPTEELLCEIWIDLLGVGEIGVRDDFFQLGGDSLMGIAMLVEIEKQTGIRAPVDAVLLNPSLGRLAAFLDEISQFGPPDPGSPWVEIQGRGRRPPLFLVHGAGGGMLWGYANLARHLGTDQPVYAFKACDPDSLEPCDSIARVAARYVLELRQFQPRGPYALGGYCFGGNVAFEMARQLEQQGQRLSLLVLMNSAPSNSSYDRVSWSPRYACRFLVNLGHWAESFLHWKWAKQRRFLRWKIVGFGKKAARWCRSKPIESGGRDVDEWVDLSAIPQHQRGLWESHVRALLRHQTGGYNGKVVLLRTRGHRLHSSCDMQCGWGELAQGGVTVRIVPGSHESLLEEPHVGALARELKVHLDQNCLQPQAI